MDERALLAEWVETEGTAGLYAAARGARVERLGRAAVAWAPSIDSPMLDRALGFTPGSSVDDVERAVAILRGGGAGSSFVQIAPHASPEGLTEKLPALGLSLYPRAWAKFVRDTEPGPWPHTTLSVRRAETKADAASYQFSWTRRRER